MSYLVESLVLHAKEFRQDIDSDSSDDLLQVERCILNQRKANRMTVKEEKLLVAFSIYKDSKSVAFMLGENEQTVSRVFKEVCDRVAFDLGGYFTDEGLLDHMQREYKLEDYQVDTLRKYMRSTTRHILLNRTYKRT